MAKKSKKIEIGISLENDIVSPNIEEVTEPIIAEVEDPKGRILISKVSEAGNAIEFTTNYYQFRKTFEKQGFTIKKKL